MINKDIRKLLERKKENDIPIWSWNDSYFSFLTFSVHSQSANILNNKVVYHKGKRNWTRLVTPEACSVSGWDVSIGRQIFSEPVVG